MNKLTLSVALAALLAGAALATPAHALNVSTDTGITAGAGGSRSDINAAINTGAEAGASTEGSSGMEPAMGPPPANRFNAGPYDLPNGSMVRGGVPAPRPVLAGEMVEPAPMAPHHYRHHHHHHHHGVKKTTTTTTTTTNGKMMKTKTTTTTPAK